MAALAGCAVQAREARPLPAADAPVTVEMDSWGAPIMRWTIDAAGNGSFGTVDEHGAEGRERPMKHVTFHAGPDGYRAVRAALAPPSAMRARRYRAGRK